MPSQLTLKDAAPQFIEQLRAAGKDEQTVRTYRNALGIAVGFFGEEKTLKNIPPAAVGRFLRSDTLLKKPDGKDRAKPTTDQIVRVLRMLFEWAVEKGAIEAVPFPKDAMPKRRRRQKAQQQEAASTPSQAGS
jgi:site-specific recombinase XerD